jgi:hypothetical protein
VEGEILEGSYANLLHSFAKQERWKNWDKRTKGKTLTALLDKNTETDISAWPLTTATQKIQNDITTFKVKLLTGLPTRNVMVNRVEAASKKGQQKKRSKQWLEKLKIKYARESCNRCPELIENTEHIFSCPSNDYIWRDTKDKIQRKIVKLSALNLSDIPIWFGPTSINTYIVDSTATEDITNYNNNWGNWGMIPKSFKEFLSTDLNQTEDIVTEIIEYSAKTITKATFKIWKERCQNLEEYAKLVIQT